jgi:hypothetical protein
VKRSNCGSCQAPVIGALTVNGKFMPVDAEPREDGNLTLTDADPIPHVTVIKAGQTVDGPRYVSHFATCSNAAQHRRRK